MLSSLERPKTLKESALLQLREAITLGFLKPGERLIERNLSDQLNVSRTVIRECLHHLESEQLVNSIPNAGPSVASLSVQQVSEIYELRTMLESSAMRACADVASNKTIVSLRQSCVSIRDFLMDQDIRSALVETQNFYHTIFMQGDKTVAWDLVERLNGRIGRLRALTLSSKGRANSGPKNLRAITRAISNHDPEAAAEACVIHLQQAKKIALQKLDTLNEEHHHG